MPSPICELINHGEFNVFVGAGISKAAPAFAPVWREMLHDVIGSLFDVMQNEHWPGLTDGAQCRSALVGAGFRPETFWQIISSHAPLSFVMESLRVVCRGRSNQNHRILAHLFNRGTLCNLLTTNFDEYLDTLISADRLKIAGVEPDRPLPDAGIYFKTHGTISDANSVRFTLEHTNHLPAWKERVLIHCLKERPLLIAGYSGWDDDLMPVLRRICESLPRVVVCRHPGAPTEPIGSLGQLGSVEIIEADIATEFHQWALANGATELVGHAVDTPDATYEPPSTRDYHLAAIRGLPIPLLPMLAADLFAFSEHLEFSERFLWLADDTTDDPRYFANLPKDLVGTIRRQLASVLARSGDTKMSRVYARLAEDVSSSTSIASAQIDRLFRMKNLVAKNDLSESEETEIEKCATSTLAMYREGVILGKSIPIYADWCLGKLRHRQGQLRDAAAFYNDAISELTDSYSAFDDFARGPGLGALDVPRLLLDAGALYLVLAVSSHEREYLDSAIKSLGLSHGLAARADNHLTAARAATNLTQAWLLIGEFDSANHWALEAIKSSDKTTNLQLQSKCRQLRDEIMRNGDRTPA